MDKLQVFNGDFHTKEALIEFIHEFIDSEALKRIYSDKVEDVYAVADARKLIDGAFEALADHYGIKSTQKETTNQAR